VKGKVNLKNLKPFPKGTSGNPKGRPKKLPEIDKLLADVLGSTDDSKSPAHEILKALLLKAKKGDVRAAEILLDRAFGKPKQGVGFELEEGVSIVIKKKQNAGS
jgi:hypothetical protein